jgi:uncharacterized protein Usg
MGSSDNIPIPAPKPKRSIRPLELTIDSIREAFAKENCELITETYGNSTTRLDYIFDGKPYHVQCYSWFTKGSRPHIPKIAAQGKTHKRKYNRDNIAELFAKEGSQFIAPDDWK